PQRHRRREAGAPRRPSAVHPPDGPLQRRLLPGDLQPDQSHELRQPDRQPELRAVHADDRRRQSADGAAWLPSDVLTRSIGDSKRPGTMCPAVLLYMIDSHCHLADEVFAPELDAVVTRAREAGLERALVILAAGDEREAAQARRVQSLWPEVRVSIG